MAVVAAVVDKVIERAYRHGAMMQAASVCGFQRGDGERQTRLYHLVNTLHKRQGRGGAAGHGGGRGTYGGYSEGTEEGTGGKEGSGEGA